MGFWGFGGVLECRGLNGLLLDDFNGCVLSLVRCAPSLPVFFLTVIVSLEAVDWGVGVVVLHDLLVVRLVEAVTLYELAHGGEVGLLQDCGLRLLQGRVHVEVELGRLVRPVVHHLVHLVRHVRRVGARVARRQGRLHFLWMFHFLQEIVDVQDQYQLPLWVAFLEELVLRHRGLIPENIRL